MAKYEIFEHLLATNDYEDFIKFSNFNYFNHSYSIFNSALILLQKPGATIVKNERYWNDHGRFVKGGSIPIILLQPKGPVTLAYDYSDTYGEQEYIDASQAKMEEMLNGRVYRKIDAEHYHKVLERLNRIGIVYDEKPYGIRQGGIITSMQYPSKTYYEKRDRHGKYVLTAVDAYFSIVINSNDDTHKKFLTLLHELGHLYCGHIHGGEKTTENCLPKFRGEFLSYEAMEFEAEAVCKLICEKYDIYNTESEKYMKQHMINGVEPDYSITDIIRAADKIITLLAMK